MVENNNDVTITLDPALDEGLVEEAIARHFNSSVQKTRKNVGVHVDDLIEVFVQLDPNDTKVSPALERNWDMITAKLKSPLNKLSEKPD